MSYCTAAEVVGKTLVKALAQASWNQTTDIAAYLAEVDAAIDASMTAMGYAVPFTTVPPLINKMAIYYARYAVIRDLYENTAPSQGGSNRRDEYKKLYEDMLTAFQEGKLRLVSSTGVELTKTSGGAQTISENVGRKFTMDQPENIDLDIDPTYVDPSVTGANS